MAMRKIKLGDMAIVITGKDKGRIGKVMKFLSENAAIVEGINLLKKHVKLDPNKPQEQQEAGIVDREGPINISNLAIYNLTLKKADRVGFKFLEDGRKVRYFKSTGEVIDL